MNEDAGAQSGGNSESRGQTYLDVAIWQLQDQMARIDAMDRKVAATFTLNAAVLALFSAGLALRDAGLCTEAWGMLIAVVGAFTANIVSSYLAYRDRQWRLEPNLDDLQQISVEMETQESTARLWAGREIQRAVEANEEELRGKVLWLRVSLALTVLGLLMATATVIVVTAPLCG